MPVADSPFPGMDPYLQRRWGDVHNKLSAFLGEALTPLLPDGLRARTEERVLLEADPDGQWYRPDVYVVERRRPGGPRGLDDAAAAAKADEDELADGPVVIDLPVEPEVDRWVQIIDTADGNRVVTAIELLSPANKAAGPRNQGYRRKLGDYARGDVRRRALATYAPFPVGRIV